MGIEAEATPVGIFPGVYDKVDDSIQRQLEFWGDKFSNYSALEDSPCFKEVLGELVKKNFVTKVGSIHSAREILGGHTPIASNTALITSEKDGVLKHRLILDCRVSGSNDKAAKRERISLPKLWDVVSDAAHLHSCAGPGEEVWFSICDFKDAFYMLPVLDAERK